MRVRIGYRVLTLWLLAVVALAGGCNLLVGDYSIRDGLAVEQEDAARGDTGPADNERGERTRSDRASTGRSPDPVADAGDDDGAH